MPGILGEPFLLGAERGDPSFAAHRAALGPLPSPAGLIAELERAGLLGRGGAAFPAATKWQSVASRAGGAAVVVANGAEGEPLSNKDRAVMETRPHLVLDGALLAGQAVGADQIFVYVGAEHSAAAGALARALGERPEAERARTRIVRAPARYTAGEESAAVNLINTGLAAPTSTPPRVFEKGVGGRPTLVQNVETLAHAALIGRFGGDWFRSLGHGTAAGNLLVSLSGGVRRPGAYEIPAGVTVGDVVKAVGGLAATPRAVLLGGYFGTWSPANEAWELPLAVAPLRAAGASLGCGVIWVLPESLPPVPAVAQVMRYLAAESSAQCGPCFFGLRSLAAACLRMAAGAGTPIDLERLRRWAEQVSGRGACRHPDGAVGFLRSALRVFAAEFEAACRPARRAA